MHDRYEKQIRFWLDHCLVSNERFFLNRWPSSSEAVVFHRINGSMHVIDEVTALILETSCTGFDSVQGLTKKLEKSFNQLGLLFDSSIESRIDELTKLELLVVNAQV